MLVMTGARRSAFSFSNYPGMPSKPEALVTFSDDIFLRTLNSMTKGGSAGGIMEDASALSGVKEAIGVMVNTEFNRLASKIILFCT